MKNFKTVIGKIIIVFAVIIVSLIIVSSNNSSICASNENLLHNENTVLETENMELKKTINALNVENTKYENMILFYPTISPIKNDDFKYVSDEFGWRLHPVYNLYQFHEGIDISANMNTPIHSTAKGVIIDIKYSTYGYGNKVIIKHEFGFETLYAHLNKINVMLGQSVNKNQLIGTVGSTGTSTGAHLHYEVRINGKSRDPLNYFKLFEEELLAFN